MHKAKIILASAVAGLLCCTNVLAMDWKTLKPKYQQVKNSGLVGEQPNGYIGVIKQGPDVDIVVSKVNAWRKKKYQQIANETGAPLGTVESEAGQKLYERAAPGHYRLVNGKWVKK